MCKEAFPMKCRKCRAEIPDESKFCMICGAKQEVKQNPKKRGNGQGSVYQLPNKTWIAIKVVGYKTADGKIKKETRSKSGFKTKKEAIEYLPNLANQPRATKSPTFKEVYDAWLPTHQAGKDTLNCYKAAMKYYEPIYNICMNDLIVDDIQDCVDECEKGKRTRQNMKTVCGLIYKYGIPRNMVPSGLNMGQYIVVRGGESGEKEAIPREDVDKLERHVADVKGADYVLCQCYLGFRPSEFISIDASNYDRKEKAFTGGAKTDAGKDRIVTVSPKIQPIIDRLVANKIAGPVFCNEDGSKMSLKKYRAMFYDVLEKCGVDNPSVEVAGVNRRRYTPHSCRHTFATMMKRVQGADKDKLELIGHTSTEMLRHYQDVSLEDLRKITDAI
jgi:integrase